MKRQSQYRGCLFLLFICFMSIIVLFCLFMASQSASTQYYSTTDISEYGVYIGNVNNTFPDEFINSFFPGNISDSFDDIQYSYRAEDQDTYGFEAYLEFIIEDPYEFEAYISSITEFGEWNTFLFDSSFMECNISNDLSIDTQPISEYTKEDSINVYSIDHAKIGKILYSVSEQRVIYIAIGVFDGGAATTGFLCYFFDRFNIDPIEYVQIADSPYRS